MTKREMYQHIATINAADAEVVEFCEHEIALLDKRVSSKKPTKTQRENVGLMDTIAAVLSGAEAPLTIAEIKAADVTLEPLSTQRISALLTKMCGEGTAVKSYEKKKAFFAAG